MSRDSIGLLMRVAEIHSRQVPCLDRSEIRQFVQAFIDRRRDFLSRAEKAGTPLYVIDTEALKANARRFVDAFAAHLKNVRVYYALKSNSHQIIISTLSQCGLGLDVSSGLELQSALRFGIGDVVFSGPGKSPEELKTAVENSKYVMVLLDSFGELRKLDQIACGFRKRVRAGVRLTTQDHGIWRKFGIPLSRLSDFLAEAGQCKWIDLQAIQFHTSWNLTPEAQVVVIARLGAELRSIAPEDRQRIKFVDVGGGFWPEEGEWLQAAAIPKGMIETALGEIPADRRHRYKKTAVGISEFAEHIARALTNQMPDDMQYTVCVEPGRWLCHDAMHILLKVEDRKSHDVVITDGGTNAVGWDRFETEFFPVINLSRPDLAEHECLVAGSLCTPHDIWGYSYFGEGVREGDILLIPNQGAYTYSLRQEFIKPLPGSVMLPNGPAK